MRVTKCNKNVRSDTRVNKSRKSTRTVIIRQISVLCKYGQRNEAKLTAHTHTHTQSMNIESAVREKLVTPKRSRKQIINYFCRRWRLIFPIFFALGRCTHAHSAAALFASVFYVILYTHSLSLVRRDLDTELSWTVFCLLVCYFRLFFLCMSEYGKINDMIKPSTIVYAQCAYTLISVFILFYVHFLY